MGAQTLLFGVPGRAAFDEIGGIRMELETILSGAVNRGVSDIFIVPGAPVTLKIKGEMIPASDERVMPADTETLLRGIYELAQQRDMRRLLETGDDDFSFSVRGVGRFRCNAFKQRGSLAAVLRVVVFGLPDPVELNIPQQVIDLYKVRRGMVLVTGPAGSGKSTTLVCIIDRINREFRDHIVTIEDPIEYLHAHNSSIVSQREIDHDTSSYAQALRAALRQAPNVILLGEMRDYETISTALTAAETGHALFSTLHTVGAAKTIDRIIDVFPANQQQQTRIQLSMVLKAVVSQQLIPTVDGSLVPAFEVMVVNSAVQNMIREGKVHQLDNVIYGGQTQGMMTMDGEIFRLYREGRISKENAVLYSLNAEQMRKRLM